MVARHALNVFQPTRPLRGATGVALEICLELLISTHAPLAGRDSRQRDPLFLPCIFQPTRPLRGATRLLLCASHPHSNFNPRAPCGARRFTARRWNARLKFQPTRPLRGATWLSTTVMSSETFQPTRPLRGATYAQPGGFAQIPISTHAPLAGRDASDIPTIPTALKFQPTRPLRGATVNAHQIIGGYIFQPTRPLRGATMPLPRRMSRTPGFQPTRPLRGATLKNVYQHTMDDISTHAPLAGRDRHADAGRRVLLHFNPRAPCGARLTDAFT